jgi:formylglycine-generating enzyme required for sulfatase activity
VNVEEPAAAVPTEAPTQIPVAPPGMALIEGGAFTRGVAQDEVDAAVLVCIQEDTSENNQLCYREYFEDAQPVEEITLSPFYVDITEVTNVAYAQCVAAEVCTPPGNTQFYADPAFSNHPVVFVSWAQAGTYCQFVGKRLPTEAEWEKAARWDQLTGESLVYPWGDNYEAGRANTLSAGQGGTSAVTAFEGDRSTAGIQGLAGNVTEWVSDWYFPGYNGLGTLNPTGPDAQPLPEPIKVARGGSFVDIQAYARSGHRLSPNQTTQANWLGFRCAADVGTEGSIGQPVAPTPEIPTESAATPVDGEALTPAPTIQPTPANTPVP